MFATYPCRQLAHSENVSEIARERERVEAGFG